ncbi:hypothetical protein AAGS40_16285 [Paraburkholderia sp. PREW-6R]|uniref:hypothetical protein n=1 Tax=Paraburkholderia sp. PREW-6R TaxID=3141544 RepID=UPI0031F48152
MANSEHTLSHQDIVRAVIIHENIREGFWKLNVNFNVAASHGMQGPDPYLAVSIKGIGIMEASADDPLAVDAAQVCPPEPPRREHTIGVATASDGAGNIGMQFCRDVYRNVQILSAVREHAKVNPMSS